MSEKIYFTYLNRLSIVERMNGFDWQALANEMDSWKVGQRGYITISKESLPKSPEQLGYYYGRIVPSALQAFKQEPDLYLTEWIESKIVEIPKTIEGVDIYFKLKYAIYTGKYMGKGDMNKAECAAFEDFVIKWLWEKKSIVVPPADPLWATKEKQNEEEF